MLLRAISRFSWRGKTYENEQMFDCPDEVIANRLISEGNARAFANESERIESAAQEKSKSMAVSAPAAEIAKSTTVKKLKKKK